ncbi:hypothetical protein MVEN_00708700 [Mycena venus]|uniref:Transmembrane protein n=1 Tax=Mycena venus TaxID=2733690 RepID=A0A8H7D5R6_9AGAR|nr:hypothetical protein MVEN_00708700 [Mycena venus]
MTTNVAIVDNRDPLVHYAGIWFPGGTPSEYSLSTTASTTVGSTASFTFEGTSIGVYATVAAINPPQSSLSFLVDNSISGTYTPPGNLESDVHHQELWTSPTLSDGTHTLVITQTTAQNAVIYLDYFLYNTTSTSVAAYFIDDRDPRIKYTGGWRELESEGYFKHTSQGSSTKGDSLSFTFEGTAISFYGAINNGTAKGQILASISVDGGPSFSYPAPGPSPQTTNFLIFSSGDLSPGKHALVVTAETDQTVSADYFLVAPSVIIGAAVGGAVFLVLLVLIAVAVFLCVRRKKRHQGRHVKEIPSSPVLAQAVTPFAQFVASSASGLRSPFTSDHNYFTLSGSDSTPSGPYGAVPNNKLPVQLGSSSHSGHSTPTPSISSKRDAQQSASASTSSGSDSTPSGPYGAVPNNKRPVQLGSSSQSDHSTLTPSSSSAAQQSVSASGSSHSSRSGPSARSPRSPRSGEDVPPQYFE